MKKLLLILTLFLSVFVSDVDAQTQQHKGWTIENPQDWGSFQWGVTRTTYPDAAGYYYYYILVYSNSAFNNNSLATTYIKNINIDMHLTGYQSINIYLTHATCDYVSVQIAYFWSYSPYCTFTLTFDSAIPYSNSEF